VTAGRGPVGFFGQRGLIPRLVSSWLVPVMMTLAYIFMAVTAETDSSVNRGTRLAWMSLGLAFVLVIWWIIKLLVQHAAFARAVEVGDAERLVELCHGRRGPRIQVYLALACSLRDDHAAALAALDRAGELPANLRALAASVRATALVGTGDLDGARRALDAAHPRDYRDELLVRLAAARVRAADGDEAGAREQLARLADDVRAGARVRAAARALLAQKRPDAAKPS